MASPEVAMKLVEGTKLMASNPEQGLDTIMPLLYPEEFATAHPEIKQLMLAGMQMMPPTPSDAVDRTIAGIMTFNASDRLGSDKMPGANRSRRSGSSDSARECATDQKPHPAGRGLHDPQRGSCVPGRRPDRDSSAHRAVPESLGPHKIRRRLPCRASTI